LGEEFLLFNFPLLKISLCVPGYRFGFGKGGGGLFRFSWEDGFCFLGGLMGGEGGDGEEKEGYGEEKEGDGEKGGWRKEEDSRDDWTW